MNKKILKKFKLLPLKRDQEEEIKNQLFEFQREADIKAVSVAFKNLKSSRSKNKMLENDFGQFFGKEDVKYVAIDEENGEMACFFSFSVENGEANFKMALKNPEYVFGPTIIEAAKKMISLMACKYNLKKMYSLLYRRNNYQNYKRFIVKHLNAEIITDGEKITTIEYKL